MKFISDILHRLLQRRQARSLALFLTLACSSSLLVPMSAHAQALATCTVVEKAVYSPPLTNQPQNVNITLSELGACPTGVADTTSVGLEVSQVVVTSPGESCQSLVAKPVSQVEIFKWSDGNSSTFNGTSVATFTANLLNVVETGTVVAGKFAGHKATFTKTFPATTVAGCQLGLGTKVPSIYGYGTLIIL